MSSKHLLPLYIIKFIKNSWNEYLINVCKSVRNASWFTSTFRSIFSAKTAYIFKIVDKPEAYPMIVSDLYLIYKRSTSARVCISEKERMPCFIYHLKTRKSVPSLIKTPRFVSVWLKKILGYHLAFQPTSCLISWWNILPRVWYIINIWYIGW